VQIVAINKDSAKEDPLETLREAAEAKHRKYSTLKDSFRPLIFSTGGLMDLKTAKAYQEIQKAIGPTASSWLDKSLSLSLLKAKAFAASSIASRASRPTYRSAL
jgi:hypothetical protein